MNNAAALLPEIDHILLIEFNAALPVVERENVSDKYEAVMQISMAVFLLKKYLKAYEQN